jgi:hypothetical protein
VFCSEIPDGVAMEEGVLTHSLYYYIIESVPPVPRRYKEYKEK